MGKDQVQTKTNQGSIEKDTIFNGEREISVGDIRKFIPAHYFIKNEARFMISVLFSLSFTLIIGYLADRYIPFTWGALPIWIIYAAVNGTVATGLWVNQFE